MMIPMILSVILLPPPPVQSQTPPCNTSVCVTLCCPAGQIYSQSATPEHISNSSAAAKPLSAPVCSDHDGQLSWSPLWGEPGVHELSLVGRDMFACQEGTLVAAELLFGTQDMDLMNSGALRISYEDFETNSTQVYKYNSSDFCLAFTNIPDNYDYYYSDGSGLGNIGEEEENMKAAFPIRATFSVCHKEQEDKGQAFTGIFYPTAIFISDFFIFLTICVYFFLNDLRTNLFGKITIGFLLNVFICYFFVGIHYSLDLYTNKHLLNTSFCILLGYIIQHTFVGFFFWMSAMAIHITRTLTNSFAETNSSNPRKTLLRNICYAQGCPLLITLLTAIMDNLASPNSSILPNMGKFLCFLGSEYSLETPFHRTPEFLYFYLVITIIMITNVICFLLTGASLFSHWWQMKGMAQGSVNELFKTQLGTVSKLFIIMGIPWTCDVVSAAVDHAYGSEKSFEIRLVLDILNLLTGVVIFLALVCKRTVMMSLKTQLAGGGGYQSGRLTTKMSSGVRMDSSAGKVWQFRD
eukprot:GFUD01003663.1.p1 GENE.GFUD01003663.1~~GFUD01003663.1.p1  ORF type:complete len:522 (-),score=96.54 GFUD01003663.1:203-1768(-)